MIPQWGLYVVIFTGKSEDSCHSAMDWLKSLYLVLGQDKQQGKVYVQLLKVLG